MVTILIFSTYGVVWDRAAPCPHTYLSYALNYYQTKSERAQI